MASATATAFVPPPLPPDTLARQQREHEVRSGVARVYDEARRARPGVGTRRGRGHHRRVRESLSATRRDPRLARCGRRRPRGEGCRDASRCGVTDTHARRRPSRGNRRPLRERRHRPRWDSVRRSAVLLPDRGPVLVRVHPLDLEQARPQPQAGSARSARSRSSPTQRSTAARARWPSGRCASTRRSAPRSSGCAPCFCPDDLLADRPEQGLSVA